ncbi:MAG TPA: SGNH/GDSL hydrolase family protein, partial [bacterium]|nr:SGNH/GDSL hydrolase family protein [bacterium]
ATLMKGAASGSALGFRHAPDTQARLFGVDVAINSRGFRDAEIPAEKRPGETRVALLGDSVTFGWGVPYGDRFSEILERDWSRDDAPLELVNTGHGNWNTAQELAALSELLSDDPLDGILQFWYINDAEPTPEHRDAPWYARLHVAIFVWAKSDLLQRRFGNKEGFEDYYRGLYDEGAAGYAGFRSALERTGEVARSRGLPWVFVILPEFHGFPGPFQDVYAAVAADAERAGATVVDVTRAFADEDPATTWVAHNDVHPNAKGHALIARAVADAVDPSLFTRGA